MQWRAVRLLLCLGAIALSSGCLSRSAVIVEDLLVPIASTVPWLPSESDLAAAHLAAAVLAARPTQSHQDGEGVPIAAPSVALALKRLEASADEARADSLVPLGQDARNATLDDPIAYRRGASEIRSSRHLDARLKNRLDRIIDDDPLKLARRRRLDDWEILWARTFNAISEPLGSSLITGFIVAPFTIANSIIHYFAAFSNSEPLSKTQRQALALRQKFLARHPNTEWTVELQKMIDRDVLLLEKTRAIRKIRIAESAEKSGQHRLAVVHARWALSILELHPDANPDLRKRASKAFSKSDSRITKLEELRALSLESNEPQRTALQGEIDLAAEILSGPIDLASLHVETQRYMDSGGRQDRVDFIRAIAQHENGYEAEARHQLEVVARKRVEQSPMARHAAALADDQWQNPYRAFISLRRQATRDELAWRLAGEWVKRPRYPNLPVPVAYLIDVPTIAMTIIFAPVRALLSPFQQKRDFHRAAALAGYRYLLRFPNGVDQDEVLDWLFAYEMDYDRYGRALRLADMIPEFDPEERNELVEQTAESRRTIVDQLDRRDSRAQVLTGVAREFPDSEQGREAGLQARDEALNSSAQHIRITKSFLLENPDVAGDEGIGLNPRLLNDDVGDGELHPEGVVLRGGQTLEIRMIAEAAEDDDPPESRYRKIGNQRLAQISARLDAAVHRNSLADLEARQIPDANRDAYLERAALEITENEDDRATAESSFVYQSLRERYGLVRGRDSILPFDLVFRASLGDFTLGAFPRWRMPRETPDSFLYR